MLGLTITEAFMDYVVRANITDPGPWARLLLCLEVRSLCLPRDKISRDLLESRLISKTNFYGDCLRVYT